MHLWFCKVSSITSISQMGMLNCLRLWAVLMSWYKPGVSQVIGYSKMSIFSCINQNISTELTFVFLQYFSMTGYLRNTMCTWILFMGLILCQEEYYIRVMVTLIEAFIPLSLTKMVNASTLTSVSSISEKVQQNVGVYSLFRTIFRKNYLHGRVTVFMKTLKFPRCFTI